LMLAHDGPVVIGRDRATAALLAARQGMMGLVLDDAHQNPSVARKLNVCVIDAGAGFGNGHLFPAGPLREKPEVGLGRADVVILMGNETPDDEVAEALRAWAGPVFTASLTPAATSNDLSGAGPFLAFCGIGRPAKFEQTLKDCGAHLLDLVPFDDHHPYSASDLARLEQMAADESAQLITTEKDYARLPVSFQTKVKVLKIQALIDDAAGFDALLKSAIERPS
jgi:tetraacyldisaccharide 4'-kinase